MPKNEKLEITENSLNNTVPEHNNLLRKVSAENQKKNLSHTVLKQNLPINTEKLNPSADKIVVIEYQTQREEETIKMKENYLPSRQMIEMNNFATNDNQNNNVKYSQINFDEIEELFGI